MNRSNPARSVLDKAIAEYGVTDDPGGAGYVIPDGHMLDFSEGGSQRSIDHRNVEHLLPMSSRAGDEVYGSRAHDMFTFMKITGAIRVMFFVNRGSYHTLHGSGFAFIHLAKRPTRDQVDALGRAVAQTRPDRVQITKGFGAEYVEIDPATPGRVREVLEAIR